jgi:hypothetical protein
VKPITNKNGRLTAYGFYQKQVEYEGRLCLSGEPLGCKVNYHMSGYTRANEWVNVLLGTNLAQARRVFYRYAKGLLP